MSFNPFADLSHIHFVGIGGAGMSGIAEILLTDEREIEISGCDQALGEATEHLAKMGAKIHQGHTGDHLKGVDLIVISSAVSEGNPEVQAARFRGIPVVRRAEMLAELMRLKYGIAVAGTHGKTTTTSLVGTMLTRSGLDPTVIVGGRLRLLGTGARLGESNYLVAEADEFDRSFLRLSPVVAVITNIDRDHLDTYRDLDAIRDAFVTFANRVPFFGRLIVCLEDANVQQILPRLSERRLVTYGFSPQADLSAVDVVAQGGKSAFGVRLRGSLLGRLELPLPGRHNILNALAAVGVGLSLRLSFDDIASGLAAFEGVHRRFEQVGEWRGAAVIDDYAHHPTEVTATLDAARQSFPRGRLHVVFQPHLYSRTQDQAEGFGRALLLADRAVVTDVYASREAPVPGVTGELVVEAAQRSGHKNVHYCPDWHDAPALLAEGLAEGG
ncbi:MAG TPA: UDP-N-acetylmuramate--L-alanine ligase, partial [Thermoanaerobaculia bacterium]|nr:UDP-N-acetylmuramate--L-alanine ligase [Thermoanaerobaculia bacterium]